MTSWKFYNILLLSISLVITGCGRRDDSDTTSEVIPPEIVLSVVKPIADITLVADTVLNFVIPDDTCSAAEGVDIQYEILSVENNVGFTLIDSKQLSGKATQLGDVNVQISCATETSTLIDKFLITVVDIKVVPTVTITAPSLANVDDVISLTATAKNNNLFGSIVSYSWTEISNLGVTLINADSETVTFTTPDTTQQSTATFSVTVTDNAGLTATDSVDITLISTLTPDVSLSFPLAFGVYNQDSIDMFGIAEALAGDSIATVKIYVDGVEHNAIVTDNSWRIEDVILSETTEIKMWVTSVNGFINYDEINLVNDTIFSTSIDNNISDIAINDITDEIYVQVNGDYASQTQFIRFNLTSTKNSVLTVNQPNGYVYSPHIPTSVALDATSDTLFVSYKTGVSKIDLITGDESIISAATLGTGTAPEGVFDLSYDSVSEALYFTDLTNKTISTIDISTGNRSELRNSITDVLSITVNSTTGDYYYSQGTSTDSQTLLRQYDNSAVSLDSIYEVPGGSKGGPISDIAINEVGEEVFFVDGKGSLIKLDLTDNSTTEIITSLFTVEDVNDETSSIIGLHYHAVRNVLIAVGKYADETNKLLIIDPISGDYAEVANGE